MFRVYLVHFHYYAAHGWANYQDAANWAKSTGFTCRVEYNNEPLATYSPIGGWTYYDR